MTVDSKIYIVIALLLLNEEIVVTNYSNVLMEQNEKKLLHRI